MTTNSQSGQFKQIDTVEKGIAEDIKINRLKPKKLYNGFTPEEAKKLLALEKFPRITISFYKYFYISQLQEFRDAMYLVFDKLKVFGRIYLASEGINAQISVPENNFEAFKNHLNTITELKNIRLNEAVIHGQSFCVLKIKIREKIVADGINDTDFHMINRGKYVSAEEFNEMTKDGKDTLILDMRNHYEYEIGHFENAVEVPSDTFRDQLPMAVAMLKDYKEKDIIMYCTGGIRCEKASAWMLHNGFKNVYHLEGGIINYANIVRAKGLTNKFRGKNFVFDGRLGEQIGDEIIAKCHQCGNPSDTHVNCANTGCHLLFIQCENCKNLFENCCSNECQEIINLPETVQKDLRKGIFIGAKVFNKAKAKLKPKNT